LKLINNNQTVIVKIGNVVVSSNNRARLLVRILGAAICGTLGVLALAMPYAI